jgi:amidase
VKPDAFASASAVAATIRDGHSSSREIVEASIARIEGAGRRLNAVVVERFDAARAEADAADKARAEGRAGGPLAGVPITIKESFDHGGLPTTFGHPDRRDHRASADAVAVARLKSAGAIVLGKTNVPKDLADWQSFNAVYGATNNPWDEGRSPGGSSGGAAAALAAGLTALELGSDIAGSIRVPAAWCGVWGHKPTFGVVPMRGHAMAEPSAPSDILVAGPLARSAFDLELALDLLAGADAAEGSAWRLELPREPRRRAADFRIAVVTSDTQFPVDARIRTALGELAAALRSDGAAVDLDPALPLASVEHNALFVTLLRGATSGRLKPAEVEALRAKAATFPDGDPGYDALMHRGLSQSHRDWLAANDRRAALVVAWRTFFARYDALICPITTTPAFPHMQGVPKIDQFVDVDGSRRPVSDNYYWIGLPSLSWLPATTIPLGASPAGLPIGAQIIGPAFADYRCIRLAQAIETSFRRFTPPPAYALA